MSRGPADYGVAMRSDGSASERRRHASVVRTRLGFLGLSALAAAWACGGALGEAGSAKLPDGVRSRTIEHEACEDKLGRRVESVDIDNDGKPDIRRVFSGPTELCRISDLNHDGKPDMFEYFDSEGRLRRREADYDDNGIVNSIQVYQDGKLVSAELDTSSQGFIDTWDTFDPATGKLLKRERDGNGDGRIDQWWEFHGDQVTIASDRNGDGLPDPESVITLQSSTFSPVGPPPSSATGAPGASPSVGAAAGSEADAGAASPDRGPKQ